MGWYIDPATLTGTLHHVGFLTSITTPNWQEFNQTKIDPLLQEYELSTPYPFPVVNEYFYCGSNFEVIEKP
uniref:Uncharacterized protein n=1 Tax=Picornavirales sp. TaxID=1955153 RepID=A0A514D5X4_9VIRU|nr:MAG: hypothetical protein H4RhizoLitter19191_000002 [Picornavirales sp.]